MNRFNLALFVVVAFSAAVHPASAIEYPWCAEYSGEDGGGGRNCGFSTLAQCMATVSGIGGGCVRNLFYDAPPDRPASSVRKHRKRSD